MLKGGEFLRKGLFLALRLASTNRYNMKGNLLSNPGGDYALVDNIEKPKPGKNQILVKSLVAGLNPV